MLSKACFSLFLCFLEQSETAFANGKVKNVGLTSVLDDKTSQHVDQTLNINNWAGVSGRWNESCQAISKPNSTLCLTKVKCFITPNYGP